jgi:hypothetical protein
MIYFFDIDNTICKTKDGDYANATPLKGRIKKVNKLFKDGHKIVLWTARGALSGINWIPMTNVQLDDWGVQRHEVLAKPYFDKLVDDKATNDKDFFV